MKNRWVSLKVLALAVALVTPSAFASTASAATPAVSAGNSTSYVLKGDGTVWSFGYNAYGQLGVNNTVDQLSPVQVLGLTNVVQISAGHDHCLAVKSDGTVWTWGNNRYGQFGNGTVLNAPVATPAPIPDFSAL